MIMGLNILNTLVSRGHGISHGYWYVRDAVNCLFFGRSKSFQTQTF